MLGSVNLFVALFNFVPLLPLDGGHIAGALYEGSGAAWPGCSAGPTPGTSTPPRCCRSPTSSAASSLVSGVVLILADLIDPIRLF